MSQLNAGHIIWDCTCFFGDLLDLIGWRKQELCIVIDETGDKPRTGNSVHVHMRTGDPFHEISFCENIS
jgi:hypothetical protein